MAMPPQPVTAAGFFSPSVEGDPGRLLPDRSGRGDPFFGGQSPDGSTISLPVAGPGTSAEEPRPGRSQGEAQHGDQAGDPRGASKGEIFARVGNDIILASDLGVDRMRIRGIDNLRAANRGEVSPYELELMERDIKRFVRERLKQRVETKLIYQDAVKKIPADRLPALKDLLAKEFENSQVPELMKDAKAGSRLELEQRLRDEGSSLEMVKSEFIERQIAQLWQHNEVKVDEEIGRDELLRYYREHPVEFTRPGRARWEQLTVSIAKYGNPQAARAMLAQMGNEVYRGVPFSDVAKARSDGPTARDGGIWPWTTEGQLVSKKIDQAIFGLPIGELSQILEDEYDMHIVRVLQREPGRRISFEEAQAGIRKTLRKNREKEARDAFLAKVRKEIVVWTIYDEEDAKQVLLPLPIR